MIQNNMPQMTKDEAEKMLAGVIHQMKLTTAERNTLLAAIYALRSPIEISKGPKEMEPAKKAKAPLKPVKPEPEVAQ